MKNMKNKFAKTITELRHRKGITQKQAAAELGVSQALLSHYEKGVRECGLDFLLKASEFYEVPCDILLGKNELPEKQPEPEILPEKKALSNSLEIIFDIIENSGSEQFEREVWSFLMLAIYRILRVMCESREGEATVFEVSHHTYRAMADAAMQVAEVSISCAVNGQTAGFPPIADPDAMRLSSHQFSEKYKEKYSDMLFLIRSAEERMKFI